MPTQRPNILLIIPHDLGDTLGCYGHKTVVSPNLDRMAAEGVQFTNAFTPCPECTSSRSGLYSGYYPHQNGLMGLANFGWRLNKHTPHLAQRLQDAGYATHLFGVQHEHHGAMSEMGYQHVTGGRNVEPIIDDLISFLQSDDASSETPWFASCGFFDVHRHWEEPTTFDPENVGVPDYLPDRPAVRADLAMFYQNIKTMDENIGRLMAAIKADPRLENTLVIFTTDHGAPFPGAKASLYDPGVRVPFIFWNLPALTTARVSDELISNLDFAPTMLELAGVTPPQDMPGQSFLQSICGGVATERDEVGGGLFYDVAYDPMHYIRTRDWKYIRSFAVDPEEARGAQTVSSFRAGRWIRCDDFDVLGSATWQDMETEQPLPPKEELYDLRVDPVERNNRADDPAATLALADMRDRLQKMMAATDSPLQNDGHVAPPPEQVAVFDDYKPGGERFNNMLKTRGII